MNKCKYYMFALIAVYYSEIYSQTSNVNYEVFLNYVSFSTDYDDGTCEPTFLFGIRDDVNGQHENFMDAPCGSFIPNKDKCYYYNADSPSSRSNINQSIEIINNTNATYMDYHMISYEWDGNGDRCLYQCDDDGGWDNYGRRWIRTGSSSAWQTFDINNISNNGARAIMWTAWRYYKGDTQNNALDFGSLNTATKSHTNSNRAAPTGASSSMGYASKRVYYKFSVPAGGRKVIISTSGENFDDYLYLRDSNGNYITGHTTSITRELCQGTYYVWVQGVNGASGDFTLYVNPEPIVISAGTISATDDSVCEGTEIPEIKNNGNASAGYAPITYKWNSAPNGTPYQEITGATAANLPAGQTTTGNMPNLVAGQDYMYFVRRALACGGNETWSNQVFVGSPVTNISPGSIDLYEGGSAYRGTYGIPAGVDPGSFDSHYDGGFDDATGSPAPITYQWQKSTNMGGSWTNVGTNSYGYNPVASDFTDPGDYQFRRKATNGCGQEAFTNIITIKALPKDGVISGKVTSPAGLGGPGGGVPGVLVTAVRTTQVQGGNLVTDTYTATTNAQGNYTISDIYYGPGNGADFTVTPSKTEGGTVHTFTPVDYSGNETVTLKSTLKTAINIDFTDNTTFTFAGNVFQVFGVESCGMDTVGIWLNGAPVDSTDVNGNYAISIPGIGNYTIEAKYKNHTFVPADFANVFIDKDFNNRDFQSTNEQSVSGLLSDGCNNPIGDAKITFQDSLNCVIKEVYTINGQYDITLPARKYKVFLSEHVDVKVNAFFSAAQYIDLTENDQVLHFKYRETPVIQVLGMPDPLVCASPYNVPLMEQAIKYDLTINIFEGQIGGCPVDTGFVVITDQISDRDGEEITLEFNNGTVAYQIFPGIPNLVAPHLKLITMAAKDTFDQQSPVFQQSSLVKGVRPREQTFTTVTPEIPFMILRDPPGDASSSFVEQTETMETAARFYALKGGSVNTWGNVKLGTQFEAGFIGFDVETEIWGQVGGSLEIGATNTKSTEAIISINTSETFSTSGNEDVTGTRGDVFVGAAMNLLYAVADVIDFDESACKVTTDVDLVIKNDGFATKYIYTEQYIRETIIPQINFLAKFTTVPDSVKFYKDQVKVWEQTLQRNEDLKMNADFVENISFSNNAPYDNVTTKSTSENLTIEFLTEVNEEVAVEMGLEIAGNGVTGGVTTQLKVEFGKSESTTTTKSLTTGYHLEDDDIGDGFTVDILTDPVYKTPVFQLVSGVSSCPWEPGTQPRDEPMLLALNPIATDVAIVEEAEFTLQLQNTSQSGEDRTYHLKLNQASNPDGAEVKIGGSPYIVPVAYYIPNGNSINVTVKVGMGASNVFTYEGLEFTLYSDCDPDIMETVVLTTFFQSPCSKVGLFAPIDSWVLNSANQTLNVHIKDYDKTLTEEVQIQFAEVGSSVWNNLSVIPAAGLNDNNPNTTNLGTIVPVNMSAIPDGLFDIRLKLICSGSNNVFSNRARGRIDTKAPLVFGIPNPIDDIYDQSQNDVISVAFDEVLNCGSASVTLTRLDDGNAVLAANLICINNVAEVIPFLLLNYPGAFRVSLTGIEDLHGNVSPPVNWVFITPGYEIDTACGPLAISNNNVDQNAISQSIYYATILESDGLVQANTTIEYNAESSISLNEEFEVVQGAVLIAEIEPCPNND